MTDSLTLWQHRHAISDVAMQELRDILCPPMPRRDTKADLSEAATISQLRLAASHVGIVTTRNNVGVLRDDTGRPVRYGLWNESPSMNKQVKSGDVIGIRPVHITPEMVGHQIGQFFMREMKAGGWHYTGKGREAAQRACIEMVNAHGGDAAFSCGEL